MYSHLLLIGWQNYCSSASYSSSKPLNLTIKAVHVDIILQIKIMGIFCPIDTLIQCLPEVYHGRPRCYQILIYFSILYPLRLKQSNIFEGFFMKSRRFHFTWMKNIYYRISMVSSKTNPIYINLNIKKTDQNKSNISTKIQNEIKYQLKLVFYRSILVSDVGPLSASEFVQCILMNWWLQNLCFLSGPNSNNIK